MEGREFKNAMYDGLARLMKALANPARLEIIEMLSQGEKSVEGIVEVTNLTIANASQHLQVLKNNNIVKSRKAGHYVYYDQKVKKAIAKLYSNLRKNNILENPEGYIRSAVRNVIMRYIDAFNLRGSTSKILKVVG